VKDIDFDLDWYFQRVCEWHIYKLNRESKYNRESSACEPDFDEYQAIIDYIDRHSQPEP
jgi:hypothetical protein